MPIPDGKVCRECRQWKPAPQLRKSKPSKFGVAALCKACNREHERARYAANPEQHRRKSQRYLANHPEQQEAKREREGRRKKEHRERWCGYSRKHHREHPDRVAARRARRLARERALPADFTAQDWHDCLAYWHNCCAICGCESSDKVTLATDHWIPLAAPECPGTVPTNILPLCHAKRGYSGGCNRVKSARNPIDWLTSKLGPEAATQKLSEIETYFAAVRRTEQGQ
jgi:hypothetical protein